MSKNTRDFAFRTVDVDQFNEDNFQDIEDEDTTEGMDQKEIMRLLNSNNNAQALDLALSNPPVNKDQLTKDEALLTVMQVLKSFKTSEIDQAVKTLGLPKQDILMKYIYRGFETPCEGSSAMLLNWHEKLVAVAGIGSIVRVLTDRKRV